MNADAAKWLADYDKIIDFASLGLTGKEFVLAYDINNIVMYEKLVRSSKSILIMDDEDFFARWQKKLEIDALLRKGDVPTLVVCHSIKDVIARMNNGNPNDIVCIEIDDKDDEFCREFVNEWERNAMKKFDLVVGNPPYNSGLDLRIHKILENCVTDIGKLVFVHPAQFMLAHKDGVAKVGGRDLDITKIESIRLFWGNSIFSTKVWPAFCVSTWLKNKETDEVNVIDDAYTRTNYVCTSNMVHLYGKDYGWIRKWLYNNVNFEDNLSIRANRVSKTKYAIEFATQRGTRTDNYTDTFVRDDFFTIVPKVDYALKQWYVNEVGYDCVSNGNRVFSFPSDKARQNFIKYLKTKSVRFILSLSKVTNTLVSGELNQIPWMDFTRSYSDKDLREMWNIDEKLWKFIDEHIPAYYPDWHFDGIY